MVPQKPPLTLTVTWALPYDPRSAYAPDTPFTRTLREFLDGDLATRNSIFKLIPRCHAPRKGAQHLWWPTPIPIRELHRRLSCPWQARPYSRPFSRP